MLEIKNVTKKYYSLVAVDNVSFDIPQGEVVGILGPNGAGKTTLFKLIAGFLQPDSGTIRPRSKPWPAMGLKPERLLFPNNMKVAAYLRLVAGVSNSRNVDQTVRDVLQRVQLTEAASKRIKDCSKGMRQRLGLAQVLIGDPPLLLLDEPTNGLDPEGQAAIVEMIQQLKASGKTILLSSHQLHEVTQVCTQLVILNHGRVHYQSRMADALTLRPHVTIEAVHPVDDLAPVLTALHPDIDVVGHLVILNDEAIALRRHVLSLLLGTGHDIVHVVQKRITLEEIYAEAVQ